MLSLYFLVLFPHLPRCFLSAALLLGWTSVLFPSFGFPLHAHHLLQSKQRNLGIDLHVLVVTNLHPTQVNALQHLLRSKQRIKGIDRRMLVVENTHLFQVNHLQQSL